MTNRYEQRFLIDLAFRVAQGFPARSVVAQELSSWVEDQDLGFDWDQTAVRFMCPYLIHQWANKYCIADRIGKSSGWAPGCAAREKNLLTGVAQ